MRITPSISMASALLIILFVFTTVGTPSAFATANRSNHAGVKKARLKAHKKLRTAQRHKEVRFAKAAATNRWRGRGLASRYANSEVPRRAPEYNWRTAATYGGSVPQPVGRQSVLTPPGQAGGQRYVQPATPQAQGVQAPGTVCYNYNPCTTCWSAPYYQPYYQPHYQWNAPATYGYRGTPQPTAAKPRYTLPPAQPVQSYARPQARPAQRYAQRPVEPARHYAPPPARQAQAAPATQQPRTTTNQRVACYNTSWWNTWPFSYLSGWCY